MIQLPVFQGDFPRFTEGAENAKREAANFVSETQRPGAGADFGPRQRNAERDSIRIENRTGVDLDWGDIVALGDPIIDPTDNLAEWWHRPAFKGELPAWLPQWRHPGRFAICTEPIPSTVGSGVYGVGTAFASGVGWAKVKIRDINHEYADVDWVGGGIRLTSTDAGSAAVQILAIEDSAAPAGQCGGGTDEKWAYVRIQNGGQFTLVGKVTVAFAPFHCSGGSGGENLCPPKGKVQVYWLNPSTECLQAVLDRDGNAIFVCPYNQECRPIPIDEWVRLHCDRWAAWWATPQEPVFAMLRAVDCIKPGDTNKTATVQKQGSAGYEDDSAYTDPVTVDNTDCLVFALPGELFTARREGCCTEKWIPDSPYGLTRRVRIDTCIDCKASGTATVLQSTCGGSGGGCDGEDADCSTITVCNASGRPIAPCGPEEAVAQLTPGVPADEKDCCWYLQAGPYPTRAKATLGSKLCPTDESASVSDATFPTFCGEWEKPTSAKNPYGLAGCESSAVELAPNFDGCKCEWDIVQVQPRAKAILHDLRVSCESGCKVEKQEYKEVLVWSCDDTVCVTPEWETLFEGTMVDVMVDMSTTCVGESGCSGKGLEKTYAKVCVLCEGTAPDSDTIPFTSQTLTRLVKVVEGSECSDCKIRYETITLCGLWCESATGDTVAFTANGVDVLTDVSIDCDGIHKTSTKAYVLCACESSESVSETSITTEVIAGDCISVSTENCQTTVTNTMAITGGCGIKATKNGCTYSISLDSANSEKTTLRVLCGVEVSPIEIECVEGSGGWTFETTGGVVTEKYATLILPSCGIEYSDECGGGSGGGGGGSDETEGKSLMQLCIELGECPPGQIGIVNVATQTASCQSVNDPIPDGYVQCYLNSDEPADGYGLTINGLSATTAPHHFAYNFLGMPAGATKYVITVVGSAGSSATVGPSTAQEEVVGQEYWGALNDNFADAQPGESFAFMVEFLDAADNSIASQAFFGTLS